MTAPASRKLWHFGPIQCGSSRYNRAMNTTLLAGIDFLAPSHEVARHRPHGVGAEAAILERRAEEEIHPRVAEVRVCGTIAAVELRASGGYFSAPVTPKRAR